jgi:hypothetical protein
MRSWEDDAIPTDGEYRGVPLHAGQSEARPCPCEARKYADQPTPEPPGSSRSRFGSGQSSEPFSCTVLLLLSPRSKDC